ncbi:MAG: tetratricopeptide repeat protein [Thermoanaerobaculia bacterium]
MSDRLSRKEIKHDKFVDEMETAYEVARKNVRWIVAGFVGSLVLIGVIVGAMLWMASQERKAQLRLAEAIEILDSPLGQPTPAGTYQTEQEKIDKAEPILREITDTYSGRDAADVAGLYLARFEAGRGEIEPAIEKLNNFIDSHPKHVLAQSARISLYGLRLAAGQAQEVIADLENEISGTDAPLPADIALAILARAYEAGNQPDRSREAWQRILNEYPDSAYTLEAQRKLNRG